MTPHCKISSLLQNVEIGWILSNNLDNGKRKWGLEHGMLGDSIVQC